MVQPSWPAGPLANNPVLEGSRGSKSTLSPFLNIQLTTLCPGDKRATVLTTTGPSHEGRDANHNERGALVLAAGVTFDVAQRYVTPNARRGQGGEGRAVHARP